MFQVDKFCRLCLAEECVAVDLFSEVLEDAKVSMYQKVLDCIPDIKIQKGDGLPAFVCNTCVDRINAFCCFKETSEHVDAVLRNILKQNKNSCSDVWGQRIRAIAEEIRLFVSPANGKKTKSKENLYNQILNHIQPIPMPNKVAPDTQSDVDDDWTECISNDVSATASSPPSRNGNDKQNQSIINSKTKRKGGRRIEHACEFCGRVFSRSSHLVQHELTHVAEKPFHCSDCGKSFWYKASLIGHVKQTHTGDVNYTCEVCGKGFFKKTELARHKPTHSNETPHKCPQCGLGFKITKTLKRHLQTVHSGQRSHTCHTCGKSFAQLQTLKVHMVLHSGVKPYVCSYCGKAFAQSAPLKTHIRIHTGEKPYTCHVCQESFSTCTGLTSHAFKHQDTLPYPCSRCSLAFRLKRDLVRHEQSHNDEECHQGRIQIVKIESTSLNNENEQLHSHQSPFDETLKSVKLCQLSAPAMVEEPILLNSTSAHLSYSTSQVDTDIVSQSQNQLQR